MSWCDELFGVLLGHECVRTGEECILVVREGLVFGPYTTVSRWIPPPSTHVLYNHLSNWLWPWPWSFFWTMNASKYNDKQIIKISLLCMHPALLEHGCLCEETWSTPVPLGLTLHKAQPPQLFYLCPAPAMSQLGITKWGNAYGYSERTAKAPGSETVRYSAKSN